MSRTVKAAYIAGGDFEKVIDYSFSIEDYEHISRAE